MSNKRDIFCFDFRSNFLVSFSFFDKYRKGNVLPGFRMIECCIALFFYVNGKYLRSCRDDQLT